MHFPYLYRRKILLVTSNDICLINLYEDVLTSSFSNFIFVISVVLDIIIVLMQSITNYSYFFMFEYI